MNISVKNLAAAAKKASKHMGTASPEQKNSALEKLIDNIRKNKAAIIEANREDIAQARAEGLDAHLLERLSIENRLEAILQDVEQVILLPDPIGEVFDERTLSNQLKLAKCRIPIGVLGVIYESRPNVTVDISALAIKSGNCALLRGGTEALRTNRIIVQLVQESLHAAGLAIEAVQLIDSPDRAEVKEMLQLHESIDLIIPRGSAALQNFCREHSTIPVITGGVGVCHLFVDKTADLKRSLAVIVNAKTQRPTVCNALDTLLVHAAVAPLFIRTVVEALSELGVTFRLDEGACRLIEHSSCRLAEAEDWDTEWLSLVLGIKTVDTLEEAIGHIQQHSTGHSDGILTEDQSNAALFIRSVDSAAVYVNASTRFTDGGQFGLGGEVAISTQKLHARGPIGLKELSSYKWIVQGQYHVR